jgi:hypothetical protein
MNVLDNHLYTFVTKHDLDWEIQHPIGRYNILLGDTTSYYNREFKGTLPSDPPVVIGKCEKFLSQTVGATRCSSFQAFAVLL